MAAVSLWSGLFGISCAVSLSKSNVDSYFVVSENLMSKTNGVFQAVVGITTLSVAPLF
jgi:hypothetical protein